MHTVSLLRKQLPKPGRVVFAGMLAASLLGVAAAPTRAAFPGANGPIALVSDRDGNDEIYLTDEQGSSVVRLTSHPATDTTPAISPNGKQVAFASGRDTLEFPNPEGDRELYVMDAADEDGDHNGDNLRRLTDNAAVDDQPAWSPGGKKLAFHSTRDGNDEIYVLDAESANPARNLTNHPASDLWPVFSPDGSRLAFASRRDGNFEVYLMGADGTAVTNLTSNPANDGWPEFSPDGTRLAFGSTREATVAGEVDIWVMALDGSGTPVNLTDAMVTNERWPAWSPDGERSPSGPGAATGWAPTPRST
jgi:Tol biopolymer transport system component